ncbi:DUF2461 domain-containing protein [Deinococcus sp.]|uniref:DUF2461 domain-containing protein n=1 Tax=Deinococcus sp. TaxID=47478 RepID=UPI003C7BF52E
MASASRDQRQRALWPEVLEVVLNLPALNAFLTELKFNNSKAWFDENRGRYGLLRQEFISFMDEVIAGVAVNDPSVTAVRAQDTLFRINRDVRFTQDKAPYKTSFSAAISPGGRHSSLPVYYVQIGPDESFVGGGVHVPPPDDLRVIRDYIERFPGKADALLEHPALARSFGGLAKEGVLQRFPRGFGEASELLKFKSFTVSADFEAVAQQDLVAFIAGKCGAMQPLHAWLREALAYRKP